MDNMRQCWAEAAKHKDLFNADHKEGTLNILFDQHNNHVDIFYILM
jgi:hypothetical protein